MVTLLACIAAFAWGCFTAAMGHPVFGSFGNLILTIVPGCLFGPAFYALAQQFAGGQ